MPETRLDDTSVFFRFLMQALSLGKRKVTDKEFPTFVGWLTYTAVVGLLIMSVVIADSNRAVVASAVLLALLAVLAVLMLLWRQLHPVVLNGIAVVVVFAFVAMILGATWVLAKDVSTNTADQRTESRLTTVWPRTGNPFVDGHLEGFNRLERDHRINEGTVTVQFRRLFAPVHYADIAEILPEDFMFILAHTRRLLERYNEVFPDSKRRNAVRESTLKVKKLLGHLERLYPRGFDFERECGSTLEVWHACNSKIPNRVRNRDDPQWVREAAVILQQLNTHLVDAELADTVRVRGAERTTLQRSSPSLPTRMIGYVNGEGGCDSAQLNSGDSRGPFFEIWRNGNPNSPNAFHAPPGPLPRIVNWNREPAVVSFDSVSGVRQFKITVLGKSKPSKTVQYWNWAGEKMQAEMLPGDPMTVRLKYVGGERSSVRCAT